MKDILKRLLSRATHTFIVQGNPNLYYDAAHEIERLRAENEKLRAALKPFADKAEETEKPFADPYPADYFLWRRARDAINDAER